MASVLSEIEPLENSTSPAMATTMELPEPLTETPGMPSNPLVERVRSVSISSPRRSFSAASDWF